MQSINELNRKTTKPYERNLLNGIKEKNSNDTITPDGNINLSSSVNLINEYSELSNNKLRLGIGDWGLGIGDWGLGIGPNPQSPIPNPQSPKSPI